MFVAVEQKLQNSKHVFFILGKKRTIAEYLQIS